VLPMRYQNSMGRRTCPSYEFCQSPNGTMPDVSSFGEKMQQIMDLERECRTLYLPTLNWNHVFLS